jgi:NitT/TauT family transport system substrate-binding protein
MGHRWSKGLVLVGLLVVSACSSAPAAKPAAPAATPAGGATGAAGAATPAGAPAQGAAPAPGPRQTIQYGYLTILAGAPVFIAEERGYFAEAGFEVQYTPFDSGALMVAPVAAGQLDVIPAVPSPSLFNALARGVALTAVAVQSSASNSGLMVRKELWDSGEVRGMPDLRGRRVSFNVEGSPVDYALRLGFRRFGMGVQDVDVQRLSNSDTAPALANGAVDAGILPEPGPVLIETRGIGTRLARASEMVSPQTGSIIVIGPSMRDRGDAVITRFVSAYVRGLRDSLAAMQGDHIVDPAVLTILSKWTNLPAETIMRAEAIAVPPDGRLDLDDLNRQQDFWAEEGLIPTRTDLSKFVEYKYVDAARAQVR